MWRRAIDPSGARSRRAPPDRAHHLGLLWLPLPRRYHRLGRALVPPPAPALRRRRGAVGRTGHTGGPIDGVRLGAALRSSTYGGRAAQAASGGEPLEHG